ncbi:MAG: D-alanyl-D-alanine carboxypeptidase [Bacilli bacterium]|nr:D-alanyl-D-alanine carboxypeptidase [Bacilli bacterium]
MKKLLILITLFLFIPSVKARELDVDVTAEAVAVIDLDRDEIILEKNADKEVILASLTKMMTAYTVTQNVDNLNKRVTITNDDLFALWGFTQVGLERGDKVTYMDLLYGMMLYSGADAAQALANHISGNNAGFVKLMNEQAQKLGMRHSRFADTYGGDDNNVSTAREMAYFLDEALKDDVFYKVFTTTTKRLSNGLEATNYVRSIATFYGYDSYLLIGNKPGYTETAGLLLASYVRVNNHEYGIIVCKSKENADLSTHVLDTYKIIDYLEDNEYKEKTVIPKGTYIKKIKVENSTINEYTIVADRDVKEYLSDNELKNITFEYHITDSITNENIIGDNLGYVDILLNGEVIDTYNVHLRDDIFKSAKTSKIIILVILGLLIFIISMLAANMFAVTKKEKRKK